jgi:hypothetical protein
MRESRLGHKKVKLQSGDEIMIGKGSAGCQPAVSGSLPETSARGAKQMVRMCSRLAADYCRLAACAPQHGNSSVLSPLIRD